MAKLETNINDVDSYIWPCECGQGYLRIYFEGWESVNKPEDRFNMMFIQHCDSAPTWRDRIKTAWRVLKGQDEPVSEVVFGEAQIKSFIEWFQTHTH